MNESFRKECVSMSESEEARKKAATTYNAASDYYEGLAESDCQSVGEPEDWWAMIMGSGYRGTVEQLSPEDRERVRHANLDFIERTSLRELEANVIYASGRKIYLL